MTTIIIFAMFMTILTLLVLLNSAHREQETLRWAAERAEARAEKSDARSTDIVLAVAPLVEKTDWMTGRWGGKFDQLVQMENARNRQVDSVRRVIMSLPVVEELDPIDTLAAAGTTAGRILWGGGR